MNRTRVVFIGFAALLPLYPAAAQTTIEVASKVPYRLCRIEAVRVIDFGDADGAGIIESDVAATVRDGRGRYYVTEGYGSPIKVFDAAGSFLNTIGRRGSGPGESEAIAAVRVCRGDTLHVFDNATLRWTVYSGAATADASSTGTLTTTP